MNKKMREVEREKDPLDTLHALLARHVASNSLRMGAEPGPAVRRKGAVIPQDITA